jgi:orotidine-5'-phosphate decarboxylase
MAALKGQVCGVRFGFDDFALMGQQGIALLQELLRLASDSGFYVVLDGPQILTPWAADKAAAAILGSESNFPCDAMVISPYIGSDAVKPFLKSCKEQNKALFFAVRTPNKSAAELQDLLTGTRLVHVATAAIVNRHGETMLGKCGYSQLGALASAGNAVSLRNLRTKYNRIFLLVDGYDYPSGNAKNAAAAFDRFGHGAVVSAGPSITAAWKTAETDGTDYTVQALAAVERMKKNLTRYFTIL